MMRWCWFIPHIYFATVEMSLFGDDFSCESHSFCYREWPLRPSASSWETTSHLLRQNQSMETECLRGFKVFTAPNTHIHSHLSWHIFRLHLKKLSLKVQGWLLTTFCCSVRNMSIIGVKLWSTLFQVCVRKDSRLPRVQSLKKSTEYYVWRVEFWTEGTVISLRRPRNNK